MAAHVCVCSSILLNNQTTLISLHAKVGRYILYLRANLVTLVRVSWPKPKWTCSSVFTCHRLCSPPCIHTPNILLNASPPSPLPCHPTFDGFTLGHGLSRQHHHILDLYVVCLPICIKYLFRAVGLVGSWMLLVSVLVNVVKRSDHRCWGHYQLHPILIMPSVLHNQTNHTEKRILHSVILISSDLTQKPVLIECRPC